MLSSDPVIIKSENSDVQCCSPIYLQQGTHIHQYQPSTNHIVIPHHTTNHSSINIASTSPPPTPPPSTISFHKSPETVTEDAKRTNHLISEQRRRNTIRLGFKELTDIIPTLKNINNSKSTILFKAVEFIKHLDRRNRSLQDRLASLQLRVQVEKSTSIKKPPKPTNLHINQLSLPPDTISALIAHKNQQKQLQELQHQLILKTRYHSISIPQEDTNLHTTSTLIVPHDSNDFF